MGLWPRRPDYRAMWVALSLEVRNALAVDSYYLRSEEGFMVLDEARVKYCVYWKICSTKIHI